MVAGRRLAVPGGAALGHEVAASPADSRNGGNDGRDGEERQEAPPPPPSRHADGLCRTRSRAEPARRGAPRPPSRPARLRSPRPRRCRGRSTCRSGRTRSRRPGCCSSRRRPGSSSTSPAPSRRRPAGTCSHGSGARRASRSMGSASSPSCSPRRLAGLTVVYARRFLPLWTAGLAGVLTALAWQVVVHGSELRAYALLALLTLVFALLLERAAAEPRAGPTCGARRVGRRRRLHALLLRARRRRRHCVWLAQSSGSLATGRRCGGRRDRPRHGHAARLAPGPRRPGRARSASAGSTRSTRSSSPTCPRRSSGIRGRCTRSSAPTPALGGVGRLVILALVLGGCAVLARLGRSARLCALLVLVPLVASGIAWLAGLRIITGEQPDRRDGVRRRRACRRPPALPRRAALAAPPPGSRSRSCLYPQPIAERVRLRPGRGRARRHRLGAGRPDRRRRLAPRLPLAARVVPARRRHAAEAGRREPAPSCGWSPTYRRDARCSALARPASRAEAGTVEVGARPVGRRLLAVAARPPKAATSTRPPARAASDRGTESRHVIAPHAWPSEARVWQVVRRPRST